ncbi:MAG TPA: methyltransferase domain-containing protein, partial [Candidatus Tectomicrobia bacterium]|nr:methyltransferase domain-containing protein [Candidatus Tectomicrobia bacterium]
MRPSLLALLRCPDCACTRLTLQALSGDEAITEGVIVCDGCRASHPVIAGVPRLLPAGLRCCLPVLHPAFFARHPALAPARCAHAPDDPVAATLRTFSYQHVSLADATPEIERWRTTFLAAIPVSPDFFRGKLGLDLGCGAGRHLAWAQRWGAEMVGVDLSEGVG